MPDNTHTEDEEYQAYQFIQDVIFWFDNPKSKHYSKESYGSSFNTGAFCKEMARDLVAMQSTARQEAYERGRKDCLSVKPKEKVYTREEADGATEDFCINLQYYQKSAYNKALHDWQQAIDQLNPPAMGDEGSER